MAISKIYETITQDTCISGYKGLKQDVPTLQSDYINTVSNPNKIQTGSSFYAIDTCEDYEFEEESNQWYLQV